MPDVENNPRDKTSLTPIPLERLLILGSDQSGSFYGAYKNPTPGMFPEANSQLHITTTLNKIIYKGTNVKAYCSASSSGLAIARSISHQKSMNRISYQNFISTSERDERCLQQMKRLSSHQSNSGLILGDRLVSDGSCTNGNIINLAYHGLISVSGTYHQFAPSNPSAKLKVEMNQAINFKDIVRIEQVYATWTEHDAKYVLVWYFGHLHVFKRYFKRNVWLPVTKIGGEEKNGAIVESSIRKHTNVFKKLDEHMGNLGWRNKISNICHNSICNSDEMKRKTDEVMVHIGSIELAKSSPLTWTALDADL